MNCSWKGKKQLLSPPVLEEKGTIAFTISLGRERSDCFHHQSWKGKKRLLSPPVLEGKEAIAFTISLGRERSGCFHRQSWKGKKLLLSPSVLEEKGATAFTMITASTRWLLVLMLWLLSRFQTGESGFTTHKNSTRPKWDSQVIPKDGIYLVSVRADPCAGCTLVLNVVCQCPEKGGLMFAVIGEGIVSHAEVAVGLRKNDTLFIERVDEGERATMVSIAYVAELDSLYTTVRSDLLSYGTPVWYTHRLTNMGWKSVSHSHTFFNVPITGIYWVTARPIQSDSRMVLTAWNGARELFRAFGEGLQTTASVSGAFHMEAGTSIFTTMQTGDFIIFHVYTLLSFVYLAGNKEPNTTPHNHLAFTGRPISSQRSSPPLTIDFNFAMTLYGDMKSGHDVRIRKTGSYMISLRPFIFDSRSLRFDLHVNGIVRWSAYIDSGVSSGQTVALPLRLGDLLHVLSEESVLISHQSLFSVAFLQP